MSSYTGLKVFTKKRRFRTLEIVAFPGRFFPDPDLNLFINYNPREEV